MAFYERGDVRIAYEEAGKGFPLLIISGGGLNSTIEQGVEATARLVTDPALDGVTGRYFDVLREAKAEAQAYDAAARRALRTATERMAGMEAC